jgi:hypothetical protein
MNQKMMRKLRKENNNLGVENKNAKSSIIHIPLFTIIAKKLIMDNFQLVLFLIMSFLMGQLKIEVDQE